MRAAPRLRGLQAGGGRACWRRRSPGPAPGGRPRCGPSGLAAGSVRSDGAVAPVPGAAAVASLAGPGACAASPADDGAGPGAGDPGAVRVGDLGAPTAVPRHDSSYGTFAGEFYDLRYLSEEGEAAGG